MSGGGDDFRELRDLRDNLNCVRHRTDLPRRESTDARRTLPTSGKRTYDSDEPLPRRPETAVAVDVEHAGSVNANAQSNRDDAPVGETANQTNEYKVFSRGIAENSWHSSVHPLAKPMHHRDALTSINPTSTRAESACSSEERRTPKTHASMTEKYFSPYSNFDFEYAEGPNTEKNNVVKHSNMREERHNMVPEIRNSGRVLHSVRPSSANAMNYPLAFKVQETNRDRPFMRGHDYLEHNYATMCLRMDPGVTGPKKQGLEEQEEVTLPQDRLQWRSLATGRSDAECLGEQHEQNRASHRCRNREHVISTDSESDDSEHGGKVPKLQSHEGEGHRLEQPSSGRQGLSLEAPSEDELVMEDLNERFYELYKSD